MAGPGLHQVQRMSLQQILAPQLQQSLHLLQVPTLELRSLVQEELQQNPLLEEIPKDEPQVEIESRDGETVRETDEKSTVTNEERQEFKEEFEVLSKLDDEWREYFSQTNTVRSRSPEQEEQRQHFFDSIVQQESLQQHLLQQLNFAAVPEEKRKVAELVVGTINDDGYLLTPIEEIAVSSGIPLEDLQEALELVQTFHPVGVGARNLKECLLIQLDRLGKSRERAHAMAISSAAWAIPMVPAAYGMRPSTSHVSHTAKPAPSAPRRSVSGTSTLSKCSS